MSLPVFVRHRSVESKGASSISRQQSLPQVDADVDDDAFLQPCLPRFSAAVITNKEDMEIHLEEFRSRMRSSRISLGCFYATTEESLLEDFDERES